MALIVTRNGGAGHGFVVDNTLVSAAHGLRQGILKAFVFQGNRLVEVTPQLSSIQIHPEFEKIPQGVVFDEGGRVLLSSPVDVAVGTIRGDVQTDFVLDPQWSRTLDSARLEELKASNEWFIAHLSDIKHPSLVRQFQLGLAELNADAKVVQLPQDLIAAHIAFDSNRRQIAIQSHLPPNVFMETQLDLVSGHSGSPLFAKLPSGKFLVTGMLVANVKNGHRHGQDVVKNFFTTPKSIYQMVSVAKEACRAPLTRPK